MAIFNILKNKKKLYQRYYEKSGIQITDDPVNPSPSEIDDELDKLYHLSFDNPKKAIPTLEKYLKEYPDIPAIKNYLYNCYIQTDQEKKAENILDETIREHPNYIFGIANKIFNATEKREAEKYGHFLGTPRSIATLHPNEEKYHISAFTTYQAAAAIYETYIRENDSAIERLESLMDIGVEKERLEDIARRIAVARLNNTFNRFSDKKLTDKIVEGKRKVKFISTVEAPTFTHPEINDFYKYSVEKFPKNKIEKIISLPKETLIPDLEKVVEDGMKRWDEVFYEKDFNENTHEFLIHSLYFLAALKAEKSLPKVLDLLRMENEFMEYWFADYAEHYFYPALYYLAENQLDELKQFAIERNISGFHRLHASKVVSQLILHQPERRDEGIKWFEDVFEHHLQNENDRQLIDTDFIGISIGYITDFRGVELIPLIEKMWIKKWISETFQGDINEITKEINEQPHPYELDPLPLNIFEFYSGEYRQRKASPPERISAAFENINKTVENKAEKLIMKQYDNLLNKTISGFDEDNFENNFGEYYPPPKQVKRESPKVGRNDPCPCGSGKKFKKCCMNK